MLTIAYFSFSYNIVFVRLLLLIDYVYDYVLRRIYWNGGTAPMW